MSEAVKATYTRAELAELLGVSPRTVDRLITGNRIPGGLKVGKRGSEKTSRFSRAVVDRWIAEGFPDKLRK